MSFPEADLLEALVSMRRHLHQHPELSGSERRTAAYLKAFLADQQPTELLSDLGSGTGLLAIWNSGTPGPLIIFRAELDALPINESHTLPYHSSQHGISHKCGHDGHMTMVAGLAPWLKHKNFSGRVGLLFQPAEENGAGAASLLEDKRFLDVKPDVIFGMHNIPGFATNQLLIKPGSICAASRGMRISITGKSAHAAEPEKAVAPTPAVAALMQRLPQLPLHIGAVNLTMLTLTHVQLGEPSFGITPGEAVVYATLRAADPGDMEKLVFAAEDEVAQSTGPFEVELSYTDVFPATVNDKELCSVVQQAAKATDLGVVAMQDPFRWSEDFGHYAGIARTCFFGLGAGENQPCLHHPDYDFPETLLATGLQLYRSIVEHLSPQ